MGCIKDNLEAALDQDAILQQGYDDWLEVQEDYKKSLFNYGRHGYSKLYELANQRNFKALAQLLFDVKLPPTGLREMVNIERTKISYIPIAVHIVVACSDEHVSEAIKRYTGLPILLLLLNKLDSNRMYLYMEHATKEQKYIYKYINSLV